MTIDSADQPKLPCQVQDSLGDKLDSADKWNDTEGMYFLINIWLFHFLTTCHGRILKTWLQMVNLTKRKCKIILYKFVVNVDKYSFYTLL